MRSKSIFVPCGVSSLFEICDSIDGRPLNDPLLVGARGGGFRIATGSYTMVDASEEFEEDRVFINGEEVDGKTSLNVVELMRSQYGFKERVLVKHKILSPIGAGFGTSASGAIGVALGVAEALSIKALIDDLGRIAHTAEILALTGLGTVTALISGYGGVNLVTEPGAPGIGRVQTIFDDYNLYRLVAVTFGPIEKASVIRSMSQREKVNKWGREMLERVLNDPSIESLLKNARMFAEASGLADRRILDLCRFVEGFGAVGATQNMIGDAVHAIIVKVKTDNLVKELERRFGRSRILVSQIDSSGPRIVEDI